MKATGIVRPLDNLGRVVIPKEIRRRQHINEGDYVEFYIDGDKIVLKKYEAYGDVQQLLEQTERSIKMEDALPDEVVAALVGKFDEMKAILANAG